jgi:hypothetical protein
LAWLQPRENYIPIGGVDNRGFSGYRQWVFVWGKGELQIPFDFAQGRLFNYASPRSHGRPGQAG